jgi:hypothetical protein
MPRPANLLRLAAAAVAVGLVAAAAPGAPGLAAAGQPSGCRVKNVSQGTWFPASGGQALTRAIGRAAPGDRLNVFGRCVGTFSLNKHLTLVGTTNRQDPTTLDGAGAAASVIFVPEGVTATLVRLTITGGNPVTTVGGGVQNGGDLTLVDSAVVGNRVALDGGGVYNYGDVTLIRTRVAGNVAGGVGGGLFNEGAATLSYSRVTGNRAGSAGGGILNVSLLTLTATVVSGNLPDDCSC